MPISISEAKDRILEEARRAGFDLVGVADPAAVSRSGDHLMEALRRGYHGDMAWLAEKAAWRRDPRALWPEVKSVVMMAMNYGPEEEVLARLTRRDRGVISVYAQHRDYHDLVKKRLKAVARFIAGTYGAQVKVFVDTAPVMEKPLAAAAGLGWQGKHSNLVTRDLGSWTFLGAIFTTLDLIPDTPHADHCGDCRRCLDICPTQAFPAPYVLDARRCISYLTIEHKGHIDRVLRPLLGNRIYGCDDCLAVCPWNKFAAKAREAALQPRPDLTAPKLAELARLDDAAFRALFSGSPVKRLGRDRFIRNVLIAIGNSGNAALAETAETLLGDASPLVRAMAVWALSRLLSADAFTKLRSAHLAHERDADVRVEWS